MSNELTVKQAVPMAGTIKAAIHAFYAVGLYFSVTTGSGALIGTMLLAWSTAWCLTEFYNLFVGTFNKLQLALLVIELNDGTKLDLDGLTLADEENVDETSPD
jgi:hypothetical protein